MVGTVTRVQTDRLELIARRARRTLDDVTELWNERAAHREYILLAPSAVERRAA